MDKLEHLLLTIKPIDSVMENMQSTGTDESDDDREDKQLGSLLESVQTLALVITFPERQHIITGQVPSCQVASNSNSNLQHQTI